MKISETDTIISKFFIDSTNGIDQYDDDLIFVCKNKSKPCQSFKYIFEMINEYILNQTEGQQEFIIDIQIIIINDIDKYLINSSVIWENRLYGDQSCQWIIKTDEEIITLNPIIRFEINDNDDNNDNGNIFGVIGECKSVLQGVIIEGVVKYDEYVNNLLSFQIIDNVKLMNDNSFQVIDNSKNEPMYVDGFGKIYFCRTCKTVKNMYIENLLSFYEPTVGLIIDYSNYDYPDNVFYFFEEIEEIHNLQMKEIICCENCCRLTRKHKNITISDSLFQSLEFPLTFPCVIYRVGYSYQELYQLVFNNNTFQNIGGIRIYDWYDVIFIDCIISGFISKQIEFDCLWNVDVVCSVQFFNSKIHNFMLPPFIPPKSLRGDDQTVFSEVEEIYDSFAMICKGFTNVQYFTNVKIYIDDFTEFYENECDQNDEIGKKKCQTHNFICPFEQVYFLKIQFVYKHSAILKYCDFQTKNYEKFCYKYFPALSYIFPTIVIQCIIWPMLVGCLNFCFFFGFIYFCNVYYCGVNKKSVPFILKKKENDEEVKDDKKSSKKNKKCCSYCNSKKKGRNKKWTIVKIILMFLIKEIGNTMAVWISLSDFLIKVNPPGYTQPVDCNTLYPDSRIVCEIYKKYVRNNELYNVLFSFSIAIVVGFVFCEIIMCIVWINKHFSHFIRFSIFYLTYKEFLLYRIGSGTCYVMVICVGLILRINKYVYLNQIGSEIPTSDVVNFIFLEIVLMYKLFSIISYDGFSCYEFVYKLKRLGSILSSTFPDVKIGFSIIFSNPQDILKNVFFTTILASEHNVNELSKTSQFSHMNWNLISDFTEKDIKIMKTFFIDSNDKERRIGKLFFQPPTKSKWWKELFKRTDSKLKSTRTKTNIKQQTCTNRIIKKSVITLKNLLFFTIQMVKKVYSFWLLLFVFTRSDFKCVSDGINAYLCMSDYFLYYFLIMLVVIQSHYLIFRIIWVNKSIVSVVKTILLNLILEEWIVWRGIVVLTFSIVLVGGSLCHFWLQRDAGTSQTNSVIWLFLSIFTKPLNLLNFVLPVVYIVIEIVKAITFDGSGCIEYIRKVRNFEKEKKNNEIPELNLSISNILFHHPSEIFEELIAILLICESFEDIKEKKNYSCFAHFMWNLVDNLTPNEFIKLKSFFLSTENLSVERKFDGFCFTKPFSKPWLRSISCKKENSDENDDDMRESTKKETELLKEGIALAPIIIEEKIFLQEEEHHEKQKILEEE